MGSQFLYLRLPELPTEIVDFSASGDNTIIAAISDKRITVYGIWLVVGGATDLILRNGTTDVSGTVSLAAHQELKLELRGEPWVTTSVGRAFVINSSNAVQIGGIVSYQTSIGEASAVGPFDDYSVTNVNTTTSYNADSTSLDELANVLGSLINLFKTGTTITSSFTVTNVTTDRSYDATSTSLDELADVLGSIIASLAATGSSTDVYTPTNVTTDISFDASSTSIDEISNVIGSVIATLQGAGLLQ